MKLVYNRRGWFRVLEWLAGVVDFRTGTELPDSRGLMGKQRALIGPYASAEEALRG